MISKLKDIFNTLITKRNLVILAGVMVFVLLIWAIISIHTYLNPPSNDFYKQIVNAYNSVSDKKLKSDLFKSMDTFLNAVNADKKANLAELYKFNMSNSYFASIVSKSKCPTCFNSKYVTIDNKVAYDLIPKNAIKFKIKDFYYAVNIENNACLISTESTSDICGYGVMDINGADAPNKLGYDVYNFALVMDRNSGKFSIKPTYPDKLALKDCTAFGGYNCLNFALKNDTSYRYSILQVVPTSRAKNKRKNAKNKARIVVNKPYYDIYRIPKSNVYVFYNKSGFKGIVTPISFAKNMGNMIKFKVLQIF